MKLYSRGQVILVSLISSLCVLALGSFALLAAYSLGRGSLSPRAASKTVQGKAAGQEGLALEAEDSLLIQNGEEGISDLDDQAQSLAVQALQEAYTQEEQQNIGVYEKYNQAVVNITTEVMGLNWFAEPVPMQSGSGSGSIIDAKGYVLTNHHVIKGAYKVYLSFADGSRVEGKVRGSDSENDLAIVSFDPPAGKRLVTIPYGDSSVLKVGQKVLAIGNPFGYFDRTLTTGIVSALGRPIQESANVIIQNMIQTDAAINPGNSGGPLLNTKGEMIGINTMIYSESGGSVGIGFAVPVNTAKRVVSDLIKFGAVKRGWIDATYVVLNPDLADAIKKQGYSLGVSSGLLVSQVRKGGNADLIGIRGGKEAVRYGRRGEVIYLGGDVIVDIGGKAISDYASFLSAIEDKKPGESVRMDVMRAGKRISFTVTLSDRSERATVE